MMNRNREGDIEEMEADDIPMDLSIHIPIDNITVVNVVVEELPYSVTEEAMDLSVGASYVPRPFRRLNQVERQAFGDPRITLPNRNMRRRDAQTQTEDGTSPFATRQVLEVVTGIERESAVSPQADTDKEAAYLPLASAYETNSGNVADFQEDSVQANADIDGVSLEVGNVSAIVKGIPAFFPLSSVQNVYMEKKSCNMEELIEDRDLPPASIATLKSHHMDHETEAAVSAISDSNKAVAKPPLAPAQTSTTGNVAASQEEILQGVLKRGGTLEDAATVPAQNNVSLNSVYPHPASLPSSNSKNVACSLMELGDDVQESGRRLKEEAALSAKPDTDKYGEHSKLDFAQGIIPRNVAAFQEQIGVEWKSGHLKVKTGSATPDPGSNIETAPVSPADSNVSVVEFYTVNMVTVESESEDDIHEIPQIFPDSEQPADPGKDQVALIDKDEDIEGPLVADVILEASHLPATSQKSIKRAKEKKGGEKKTDRSFKKTKKANNNVNTVQPPSSVNDCLAAFWFKGKFYKNESQLPQKWTSYVKLNRVSLKVAIKAASKKAPKARGENNYAVLIEPEPVGLTESGLYVERSIEGFQGVEQEIFVADAVEPDLNMEERITSREESQSPILLMQEEFANVIPTVDTGGKPNAQVVSEETGVPLATEVPPVQGMAKAPPTVEVSTRLQNRSKVKDERMRGIAFGWKPDFSLSVEESGEGGKSPPFFNVPVKQHLQAPDFPKEEPRRSNEPVNENKEKHEELEKVIRRRRGRPSKQEKGKIHSNKTGGTSIEGPKKPSGSLKTNREEGKTSKYQCPQCLKPFTRKDSMNKHVELYHNNMNKHFWYVCELCGYQTVSNDEILLHIWACENRPDPDLPAKHKVEWR